MRFAVSVSSLRRPRLLPNEYTAISIALRRASSSALTLAVLAVMALQAACTVVTVHDADGFTRVEREIGFTRITLAPSVSATVAEVKSFGLLSGPMGLQAGLSWNTIAAASESCRVIVWIETAEQLDQRLWEKLEQAGNVCVVGNREKADASN